MVPRLESGRAPDLGPPDVKMAVILVVKEAVAPLVRVSQGALKPLQGAPGLASIAGIHLWRFGNNADCKATAGGCAVDTGIVIIAPAQLVWLSSPLL